LHGEVEVRRLCTATGGTIKPGDATRFRPRLFAQPSAASAFSKHRVALLPMLALVHHWTRGYWPTSLNPNLFFFRQSVAGSVWRYEPADD
jgi:hypothetical protein